jgi:SAM-dependent methyltransferase
MPGLPAEYYRNYDFIHREKDYQAEVGAVLEAALLHSHSTPTTLLEIGCGTGNHTRHFVDRSLSVTAVDIDTEMTALMRAKKIPNTTIVEGPVGQVVEDGFDIACAMFNVVNYIHDDSQLTGVFRDIRSRLAGGGIFVFDCWNGDAVRRDPPISFERHVRDSNTNWVVLKASGQLEESEEFATIRYEVDGVRHGQQVNYEYVLRSKLWSIEVVKKLLISADFTSVSTMAWMRPHIHASSDDWKIMFAAAV